MLRRCVQRPSQGFVATALSFRITKLLVTAIQSFFTEIALSTSEKEWIEQLRVERQAFFAALGEAITKWQHVEYGVFGVFAIVSGCRDAKVASAIFYSVMDFSDKLQMTHSAARASMDPKLFKERWAPLRVRCRNASEIRNALAHFWTFSGAVTQGNEEKATALVPNYFDENERHKKRKEHLNKFSRRDINSSRITFSKLAIDLMKFSSDLGSP